MNLGDKLNKEKFWYKYINLYVVYPDAFKNGKKGSLLTLTENLHYMSSMGFNALHILPFLKSPMKDAGFDVSDFYKVRIDLGGNVAFDKFINKANKMGIRVFMDLVINHVSDSHEWFQKALKGDEYFRNFFIHSTRKPRLLKVIEDKRGRWAIYRLGRRNLRSRIVFYSGQRTLPHWIEGKDGFWYYHTFYPHQIDLNWSNPEVFKAFAGVVSFWAKKGLSFRLDAVPFAGKSLTGIMEESSPKSHEILRMLHGQAKKVNKSSVFLVEAAQPTHRTKKYFGIRRVESELAYNFTLMQSLWASFVSKRQGFIWEGIEKTGNIPKHAQWITFLRNHDELSLEYMSSKQRKLVYNSLLKNGLGFRGEFGIAGRTASFLEGDVKKIILMHFLLASVNGTPAMIYGDENGKSTDKRYIKIDTRDSNRGSITAKDLARPKAKRIRQALTKIFTTRLNYPEIATNTAEHILKHRESLFAARYKIKEENLEVYANLNSHTREIEIKHGARIALSVNGGSISGEKILLPSYSGVWVARPS